MHTQKQKQNPNTDELFALLTLIAKRRIHGEANHHSRSTNRNGSSEHGPSCAVCKRSQKQAPRRSERLRKKRNLKPKKLIKKAKRVLVQCDNCWNLMCKPKIGGPTAGTCAIQILVPPALSSDEPFRIGDRICSICRYGNNYDARRDSREESHTRPPKHRQGESIGRLSYFHPN